MIHAGPKDAPPVEVGPTAAGRRWSCVKKSTLLAQPYGTYPADQAEKPRAMRRGFKTTAERNAIAVRRRLEIAPHGPLPARKLAAKLNIRIVDVNELPGFTRDTPDESGFASSAASVLSGTDTVIVYDSTRPPARQESRLMGELAHVLLGHEPDTVVKQRVLLSRFDAVQNAEAAYLGGCLQIPREGLLWALGRRMSTAEIARHFGASEPMVRYRRNVTGVDRQLAHRAHRLIHGDS